MKEQKKPKIDWYELFVNCNLDLTVLESITATSSPSEGQSEHKKESS